MANRLRHIAIRRLKRDLIELQTANISSIAAHPIDDDIFEWHVNIKPADGVYFGVYFHLILIFPESYPIKPPKGIDIHTFYMHIKYTLLICIICTKYKLKLNKY